MHPQCLICYTPLGDEEGESKAYTPLCGHVLCEPCSYEMASTQHTCPLRCKNDRPTYRVVQMQFEESDQEPDATGTLGRRLVALGYGAEMQDAGRVKLAHEVEIVAGKVKVQTRRLVAHHDKIARIYAQTTVLQEEAQKVMNACQAQVHAIEELRRQVYEAECDVGTTLRPGNSSSNTIVPARRLHSPEEDLSTPQAKRPRKHVD